MKIDAKMGVVLEKREPVLPVEARLIQADGGVTLDLRDQNGDWFPILRVDKDGLMLRSVGGKRLTNICVKSRAHRDTPSIEYIWTRED